MKKGIFFFLAIYFLQTNTVHAQANAIDSIKQLLQNGKKDTSRVVLLNQLSRLYLYNKPDTALSLAQQGYALAKEIGFTKGAAVSLNRMGIAFDGTGNYPKALELHIASLKMTEDVKDERMIYISMSNIGSDYDYQGNYRMSVSYQLQALSIAQRLNNKTGIQICLSNLGDSYEKLDMLDSARIYTNQAYELAMELKNIGSTGIALNNLGNIYSKMGQDVIAMGNYNLSLPYSLQADNEDGLCETYLGMAKLFRRAGKTDSCLYYAKLSLAYGKKGDFTARVMNASNFLTDYYTSIHNVDSAFAYQSATIAAKDSLFSQEKAREIQSLSFDESMRQQNIALAKTAEKKQRRNNIQFAIIAIAIVCFIIIFLLLSRTVIVNEKWIRFLGVLGLLLFFEFINLFLHPYISGVTNDSPLYTLLIMVMVASLVIPFHHRIEHWIKGKMVIKNKKIRLAAAKRTVARLEKEGENLTGS